jgi:SAM-dependent methyltransferase
MLTVRLERLELQPGQWVLDLGCGEGRHVHGVQVFGGVNVVGLDMDLRALAKAKLGAKSLASGAGDNAVVSLVQGDAYRLPFSDGAFDVVICSEVLEHLHEYPRVVAELRRVLKGGGLFAASVPRAWPEAVCWFLARGPGGYADQPGGHVRIFDAGTLRRQISACGFAFLGRHNAHALHSPYWWLKCALWKRRDDHPLVLLYHRFLTWDLMSRPLLTRGLEALLQPVLGKSVAFYFRAAT